MRTKQECKEIIQEKQAASLAKRREKIATAVLAGVLAHVGRGFDAVSLAKEAVCAADALISELDKGRKHDDHN